MVFDNYDSFTFNLCDYLKQLGQNILVIRNDEKSLEEIEELNFKGIILSPGPGKPKDSGILTSVIERWYQRVPILGICLGHQALACHFGAELIKAPFPMHGKVSEIKTDNHKMWQNTATLFSVCRYHSLVIKYQENSVIDYTAFSMDDNQIMAFAHKKLPIWGIQFHPEAILTQYGIEIINNWLICFNLQERRKPC